MLKKLCLFLVVVSVIISLSGCDLLLVSGGAAGGYYVGKNYDIEKKSD